jgi:hypothetical protein
VVSSGSDIYVGGTSTSGNGYSNGATVWKNGILDWAVDYPIIGQVNSVALSGNDVYAAGIFTEPGGATTASWWKNGIQLRLSGPVDSVFAGGIAINGQDVYMAGGTGSVNQNNDLALYWKNGVPITLKNSVVSPIKNGTDSTGLYANGIAVKFNQVVPAD